VDRRKLLPGADYIINTIEVSGVHTVKLDNDIPAKYGVGQCIGDTMGPGGLFKALRTGPVWLAILRDVLELCPNAQVLNYTNPMSTMCLTAARAAGKARVVGLCHSVQGTSHELAAYAGVPYVDMTWKVGGINHMAWFVELSHNGKDLYPKLKKAYEKDPHKFENDRVRMDMMEHFGYFVTESSQHFSEYLPYYRKRKDLLKEYCSKAASGYYANEWPKWRKERDAFRIRQIQGKEPGWVKDRSWEYAGFIIQAMETNDPFTVYVSVPNRALIDNLPQTGVVEVACNVDRRGITPMKFGSLPVQCATLCANSMGFHDLAATAIIERSKEAAAMALMLDPLTAAVCSPAEIKKMTMELFKAEAKYLPGYK
jgi:alpha-galactosidase